MCSRFGPVLGVIVVAALAVPPATHASDERYSPRVGSVISGGSGVRGFGSSRVRGVGRPAITRGNHPLGFAPVASE
jgi:hypothetical protein